MTLVSSHSYCSGFKDQLAHPGSLMPPVSEYRFFLSDLDNDRITGVKERATISPNLSRLPGDLDCQGTTV